MEPQHQELRRLQNTLVLLNTLRANHEQAVDMNYSNYMESPQAGPGSNARQAPPSPSQGMNANGMNGGGLPFGMAGFPTPAGHQSDLNHIMVMVEELSQVLEKNKKTTESINEKVGKVRERAKNLNLSNDELIALVAAEMNEGSQNLDKENSELRKDLSVALYEKNENWKLLLHGANILKDVIEKTHAFRAREDAAVLAWHKNYRDQLAHEREENLQLRCQIEDLRAAAARANGHIRAMRRYMTDNDEWHELRVQNDAFRKEKRMWKRMALPLILDDDPMWSDDDDIIDPEEKKRLARVQAEKEKKEKEQDNGEGPSTSA